jgi:hypothetical protein
MHTLPITIMAGARFGYSIWQTFENEERPVFIAGLSSKIEVMNLISAMLTEMEGHDIGDSPTDYAKRFAAAPEQPPNPIRNPYEAVRGQGQGFNGKISSLLQRAGFDSEPAHAVG